MVDEEDRVVRALMSRILADAEEMHELGVEEDIYYTECRGSQEQWAVRSVIAHMAQQGYLRRVKDQHKRNMLYFIRYPPSLLPEDADGAGVAWLWAIALIAVLLMGLFVFLVRGRGPAASISLPAPLNSGFSTISCRTCPVPRAGSRA